ncbi:PREDICTED: uncharacterized protein LOC104816574 [Tarenaya hassleriana]|uniref:uncharacterized protein LOC104816574 n=1 Tax=Tarenaya hassleriana TaxID=28532 RepID=UPI00053C94D8|nr:PREDICTED: uncharacterized protein LOC104816574 [Tarenaya hassleriana]XP_010543762.1 PREDICTED: uncharacterized protein LOC104816574 [Tarenaya hassleriana]
MADSKKYQASSLSSSSSDHLFVGRVSSSSLLDTVYPPPPSVGARKGNPATEVDSSKSQSNEQKAKEFSYKNGEGHYRMSPNESCNFSSSMMFYGGQRHYTPIIHDHADSPVSYLRSTQASRRDDINDPEGTENGAASRGNWWQGSLYY